MCAYYAGPSNAARQPMANSRPKPAAPRAAQPLPAQREVLEYATFPVRGLAYPTQPHPNRVTSSKSHTDPVRAISISSDGSTLATTGNDRTVKLWDYRPPTSSKPLSFTYRETLLLPSPESDKEKDKSTPSSSSSKTTTQPVSHLLFSPLPSSPLLFLTTDPSPSRTSPQPSPQLILWNIKTRQQLATWDLKHLCQTIAFHPSGRQLAVACFDRTRKVDYCVFLWEKNKVLGEEGMEGEEESPRWEKRLDIKLGEQGFKVDGLGADPTREVLELNGLSFSKSGNRIFAGVQDGGLYSWSFPILPRELPAASPTAGGDEMEVDPVEVEADVVENGEEGEKEDEKEKEEDEEGRRRLDVPQETETPMGSPRGRELELEVEGRGEGEGSATPAVQPEEGEETVADPAATGEVEGDLQSVEAPEDKIADEDVDMDGTAASSPLSPVPEAIMSLPLLEGLVEGEVEGEMETDAPAETVEVEAGTEEAVPAEGDVEMKDVAEPEVAVPQEKEPTIPPPAEAAQPDVPPPAVPSIEVVEPVKPVEEEVDQPEPQRLDFLFRIQGNAGCMNCMDLDPRGRFLATGGSDGLVNMLTTKEWIGMRAFDSYTEEIKYLRFSHDGELIAATGDDRCIDIMSTATGTTIYRIPVKTNVAALTWHPKERVLCYALTDHSSGVEGQVGDWYWVSL